MEKTQVTDSKLERFLLPLQHGFKREVVFRASSDRNDIYYHAPKGPKLRSYSDIKKYLQKHRDLPFTIDNFTMNHCALGFEEKYEIVRAAKFCTPFLPKQKKLVQNKNPPSKLVKKQNTPKKRRRIKSSKQKNPKSLKTINHSLNLLITKVSNRDWKVKGDNKIKKKLERPFSKHFHDVSAIPNENHASIVNSNLQRVNGNTLSKSLSIDSHFENGVNRNETKPLVKANDDDKKEADYELNYINVDDLNTITDEADATTSNLPVRSSSELHDPLQTSDNINNDANNPLHRELFNVSKDLTKILRSREKGYLDLLTIKSDDLHTPSKSNAVKLNQSMAIMNQMSCKKQKLGQSMNKQSAFISKVNSSIGKYFFTNGFPVSVNNSTSTSLKSNSVIANDHSHDIGTSSNLDNIKAFASTSSLNENKYQFENTSNLRKVRIRTSSFKLPVSLAPNHDFPLASSYIPPNKMTSNCSTYILPNKMTSNCAPIIPPNKMTSNCAPIIPPNYMTSNCSPYIPPNKMTSNCSPYIPPNKMTSNCFPLASNRHGIDLVDHSVPLPESGLRPCNLIKKEVVSSDDSLPVIVNSFSLKYPSMVKKEFFNSPDQSAVKRISAPESPCETAVRDSNIAKKIITTMRIEVKDLVVSNYGTFREDTVKLYMHSTSRQEYLKLIAIESVYQQMPALAGATGLVYVKKNAVYNNHSGIEELFVSDFNLLSSADVELLFRKTNTTIISVQDTMFTTSQSKIPYPPSAESLDYYNQAKAAFSSSHFSSVSCANLYSGRKILNNASSISRERECQNEVKQSAPISKEVQYLKSYTPYHDDKAGLSSNSVSENSNSKDSNMEEDYNLFNLPTTLSAVERVLKT